MYATEWILFAALTALGLITYYYYSSYTKRKHHLDQKLKTFIEILNNCAFYERGVVHSSSINEVNMSDETNKESIHLKIEEDQILCSWNYNNGKKEYSKTMKFPKNHGLSQSSQINMAEEVLINKINLLKGE